MSDVEFEQDAEFAKMRAQSYAKSNPDAVFSEGIVEPPKGFSGWLMKKGFIKSEFQGRIIQMVIILINVAITTFVVIKFIL